MSTPDLNLLFTLNAVLSEGSVVRASRRLRLSPSAMSRALARVREVTGDPLLVRAGRGLVPTPRALELREQVERLVDEAGSVLRPVTAPDLNGVTRVFTIRTSEGFVETFGPALIARAAQQAPGVRLHFVAKQTRDGAALQGSTGGGREARPPARWFSGHTKAKDCASCRWACSCCAGHHSTCWVS